MLVGAGTVLNREQADRAVFHLGRRGVAFDETSFTYDNDGHLKLAYLSEEIGGFGVHLTNN